MSSQTKIVCGEALRVAYRYYARLHAGACDGGIDTAGFWAQRMEDVNNAYYDLMGEYIDSETRV